MQSVRALLYVLAVVYFLLLVLDVIGVTNHIRLSPKLAMNLQIAVLGILSVHAVIRGVYFILLGANKISDVQKVS